MRSLPPILLSIALQLGTVVGQTTYKDNSPTCQCYYVNSDQNPTYFVNHLFYDFRSAATSPQEYTSQAPLVNETQSDGNEETPDQQYLNNTSWNNDWGIQNWGTNPSEGAPVMMQNSPANVYIVQANPSELGTSNDTQTTYLTLRTERLPTFQSTAEIENEQKNLMYASIRMRARVVGARGAVAGFFTFYDDNNESDIEILTDDNYTTWRFSNQPSVDKNGNDIPQSSLAPSNLPPWDEWHEHRIDWNPGMVRWFVDGQYAAENSYSVPRKPTGLVLNIWSNGGDWSGNMSVGDFAELQIQWVQLVFNTSGPRDGSPGGNKKRFTDELQHWWQKRKSNGCKTVCVVDGVQTAGYPQVAGVSATGTTTAGATGTATAAAHRETLTSMFWILVATTSIFSVLSSS